MQFEVSILITDEYSVSDLVAEDIPDRYLWSEDGQMLFTSTILPSDEHIWQLIEYIFGTTEPISNIYQDKDVYVYDLSGIRHKLIPLDKVGENYASWLHETGRKNSMDEYGMLIDFVGLASKSDSKKYVLLIVRSCHHTS